MKILKAFVPVGREILEVDAIEHGGSLWLVPFWQTSQDGKWMRPGRIIRLDLVPHDRIDSGVPGDIVVNVPIPTALLEDTPYSGEEGLFDVQDNPELKIPGPRTIH